MKSQSILVFVSVMTIVGLGLLLPWHFFVNANPRTKPDNSLVLEFRTHLEKSKQPADPRPGWLITRELGKIASEQGRLESYKGTHSDFYEEYRTYTNPRIGSRYLNGLEKLYGSDSTNPKIAPALLAAALIIGIGTVALISLKFSRRTT